MPRGPRIDAPGLVQHVMIRGVDRRPIFHDSQDYESFLSRLDRLIPELHFRCFAWVLMPNHAHFALQTGSVPLHKLMLRLGTGYVGTFNRRYQRVGHLMQDRYKSRLVEGDDDLLNLVTYIHCNPLRARLVENAESLRAFRWSGHGALTGGRPARPFEACSATLRLFAEDLHEARRRMCFRIREVANTARADREVLDTRSFTPARANGPGGAPPSLHQFIRAVCAHHGLTPADIGSGRRGVRVMEARGEIAHRATRELGRSAATVARALGVSESTVCRALAHRRRPLPEGQGASIQAPDRALVAPSETPQGTTGYPR